MDESDGMSMLPRKRVSQACVPCSRRKTKCDGGLPICGQCLHRGVQDCAYPVSKRNKRERRTISSLPDSALGPGSSPVVRTPVSNYNLETNSRGAQARSQPHDGVDAHESYSSVPIGARVGRGFSTRTAPTALPEIPRDVSTRLFKAYFDTIHPTWPILYKPVYDMLDHQRLLDTIPQQLLYAIYSIAACVQPNDDSPNPRANEKTLPSPSLLFQAALLALGNDHTGEGFHPLKFLKPSIESCQALTILALQQHGVAESESAAVLCSLACGMAIELRLHREMKTISAPIDVQVRSRLWWNIFILDKMISSELARPVLLRAEDTDTPYPSALESDEYQLLSLNMASQSGAVSVKTHTISGFHTTIQFSKVVERVLREIYSVSGRSVILENLPAAEEARLRLWQELKGYHHMLDSSPLKLDMNSSAPAPPVTITNIVWMWCVTILVHRPFVPHRPEINDSTHPLHICVSAAQNVCSILEKYSENLAILSCDIIFPIFTSASILSYASDRFNIKDPETQRLIQLCVRWLAILGKNWKNAGIFKDTLSRDLGPIKGNGFNAADKQAPGPGLRSANSPPTNEWQATSESSPANDRHIIGDEWAFLENLGDPSDEFYTMDNSFREVLAKQFDTDRMS